MIHADGKLIGNGRDLGRCGEGAGAVGSRWIIGQRVGIENRLDRGRDRNGKRVGNARVCSVRKAHGHDSVALVGGGNREHLGGSENLAKALVLAYEVGAVAAIVEMGKNDGTADRAAEFVANERRDAATVEADLVEIVACIERGVAEEFKHAAVKAVGAGARDDVGESGRSVPDLGRHDTGTGLDFLYGVDVEVGEGGAAHLGVGGVDAVHGEDGGGTALSVDRKLLREVGGAVGVGHGSSGEEQEFAEVARVERQAGNLGSGKTFSAAGLGRGGGLLLLGDEGSVGSREREVGYEFGARR